MFWWCWRVLEWMSRGLVWAFVIVLATDWIFWPLPLAVKLGPGGWAVAVFGCGLFGFFSLGFVRDKAEVRLEVLAGSYAEVLWALFGVFVNGVLGRAARYGFVFLCFQFGRWSVDENRFVLCHWAYRVVTSSWKGE